MKDLSIVRGFIFIVFIGIMLTACLPDPLEVEGLPIVKPEIVVSTQIIPDESLIVLLTRSFGALDASDDSDPLEVLDLIAVNDAVVTITGPSKTDTLLFLGNGIYGGIFIDLVAGEEYSLEVVSASLGSVSSTTKVLPQVQFEDLDAKLYFDGFDDTLAEVSYRIIDLPEKNWYMLNVVEVKADNVEQQLLNPRTFSRLIDDAEFQSPNYGEVFRVFPAEFDKGDTLAISMSNISKEYYDFVQMRLDNRFSLVEFLGEPVNYPSNIKGGKGFFNLYVPDIRFMVLK
jgi:hypothetical protein